MSWSCARPAHRGGFGAWWSGACFIVLVGAALGAGCAGSDPSSESESSAHQALGATEEPTPDSDWRRRAASAIEAREYTASRTALGLQAPNRRHRLRTYFDPEGVRVFDRRSDDAGPIVGLTLRRVGRDAELDDVAPASISHAGARVELTRGRWLVEWYENSTSGLEQGFTLSTRPPGTGPLTLDVGVSHATATVGGDAIDFHSPNGRSLHFAKLHSWDADGREVESRFEAATGGYRIVVDDSNARYPLVVDPLLTGVADAAFQANQLVANYGISVGSAGDVNGDGFADVIIGASQYDNGQLDEGAAFIHLGGPGGLANGDPTSADTILESDQESAFLGERGVGSAGDVNGDGYDDVIVGAYLYDDTSFGEEGAAWIFHGGPSGIPDGTPATADTVLQGDQLFGFFGWDVAGAGDVNGDGYADVIVGAYLYDAGETDEGAAFVFHGGASGVADGGPGTADAQLESDQDSAQFGWSVAPAGDVDADGYGDVVVGAVLYDGGIFDSGAAFAFYGGPLGVEDGDPGNADFTVAAFPTDSRAGEAVASLGDLDGDGYGDIAVGAPRFDTPTDTDAGAVFTYYGSATGLVVRPGFTTLSGSYAGARLGHSLAGPGDIDGDGFGDLIAGAPEFTGVVSSENGEGSVVVFFGGPTGISDGTNPQIRVESNQALANLGMSVAAVGDVDGDGLDDILAGAPFYTDGELSEGHAFYYRGGDSGLFPLTSLIALQMEWIDSNQSFAYLGSSVASAGDVNGDGYDDVIIGAWNYDGGHTGEGAAFVFLGGPAGIPGSPAAGAHAQFESNQMAANMGWSVASAGDVNGDGYADVIVGVPRYSNGEAAEGAAFVFLGSAVGMSDGDPGTAHALLESNQTSSYFGGSVASAGDINGDGYADVIVGGTEYTAGEPEEGAAFLFLGSPTGIADGDPATAHAQLESNQSDSDFGIVSSAGDVNGDGYSDVIVGAGFYDPRGAVFIFQGGPSGIPDGGPATADTTIESDQDGDDFGSAVASAGDVNADGFSDVIVGNPRYTSGQNNEGAAYVFLGGASGIPDSDAGIAQWRIESDQESASLGNSVASAGDVNGDGYGDVLVAADLYDAIGDDDGLVVLHLGSASGVVDNGLVGAARIWGEQNQIRLAQSVASAGDVNGDGFADVIFGAMFVDNGLPTEGIAVVRRGGQPSREVLLRQLRGDGSGIPVQPGGLSHRSDGWQVEMRVTSPRGRERAKLEVESCPSGTAFGDATCDMQRTPTWVDLGSTGADFSLAISGLTPDTPYRWRARPVYAAYSSTEPGIVPAERIGTWRRIAGGGTASPDIRAVPEPGLVPSLILGSIALSAARRRRDECDEATSSIG